MANFCQILNETCLTGSRRILQKKGIMTEEQIRKDLEDSLSKDQMAAVTVRLSMPRAVWCDVLRGHAALQNLSTELVRFELD